MVTEEEVERYKSLLNCVDFNKIMEVLSTHPNMVKRIKHLTSLEPIT